MLAVHHAPRELEVPADLTAALGADPAARAFFARVFFARAFFARAFFARVFFARAFFARAFFDSISYSRRRVVLAVDSVTTDATRRRRIASSVEKLADGRET